jgi:hypothetical protein
VVFESLIQRPRGQSGSRGGEGWSCDGEMRHSVRPGSSPKPRGGVSNQGRANCLLGNQLGDMNSWQWGSTGEQRAEAPANNYERPQSRSTCTTLLHCTIHVWAPAAIRGQYIEFSSWPYPVQQIFSHPANFSRPTTFLSLPGPTPSSRSTGEHRNWSLTRHDVIFG